MGTIEGLAQGLRLERFQVITTDGHGLRVMAPPMYPGIASGVEWAIWDNSGELGIDRVNSGELPRFIPTEQESRQVGPLTLLCWVVDTMRNEPIDFLGGHLD